MAASKAPARAIRRCAIYTRKSSEEGLEQDFNSLDAQREACAAYIQSQQHEGWTVLPHGYDDGGKSGATLERPALRRLLDDIRQHRLDVIVVYKVDRLTRSLADFAKLVEVFDAHQVSFVSITQQFNTTTSMGRLTLNVLLSFAQFEREVTAERIRDKIAASKQRGLWMGGHPPLGYDVVDRHLVVNEAEAETVREIFRRYLQLKNVAELKVDLEARGIGSKRHLGRGGSPMQRGALYRLLSNPLYRGQIKHKDRAYPGQHRAIVDDDLWTAVHTLLRNNREEHQLRTRAAHASLLTGRLYDGDGRRLTPTHAVKQGRRYRYYISQPLTAGTKVAACDGPLRLPAAELEREITDRLRQTLADRAVLAELLMPENRSASTLARRLQRCEAVAGSWSKRSTAERRTLVLTLLARISVTATEVSLHLDPDGLRRVADDQPLTPVAPAHESCNPVMLTFPLSRGHAKGGLKLVLGDFNDRPTRADPKIVRILQLAHAYYARIVAADEETPMTTLARESRVTLTYFTKVVRLAWLAPDITAALLEGRHPPSLNQLKLIRLSRRLPLDWQQQRRLLGFAEPVAAR